MYHVPLVFRCIYACSDEGDKDGDGKEGSELPEGWERVGIACPLVCRLLGSMRKTLL